MIRVFVSRSGWSSVARPNPEVRAIDKDPCAKKDLNKRPLRIDPFGKAQRYPSAGQRLRAVKRGAILHEHAVDSDNFGLRLYFHVAKARVNAARVDQATCAQVDGERRFSARRDRSRINLSRQLLCQRATGVFDRDLIYARAGLQQLYAKLNHRLRRRGDLAVVERLPTTPQRIVPRRRLNAGNSRGPVTLANQH